MKINLWLIPMLLLGGGVLLSVCGKSDKLLLSPGGPENNTGYDAPKVIAPTDCGENDEPSLPPGSLVNNTIYNAPKVMESSEIVTFYCEFSTVDLMLPEGDSELADNIYTLTAEWKDGVVTGSYDLRSGITGDGSRHSFQAGLEFLDELQKLVAKHDLPQYNGLSRHTYGLPEEFGAELSIQYASGGSVSAYDNQDCFLPLEAIEDLEGLFRQQIEPETAPRHVPNGPAQ